MQERQEQPENRSLPLKWVERLFERLIMYHGARFVNQFIGLDIETVKRIWAEELGRYDGETLRRALEVVKTDHEVPTLQRFLAACRNQGPQMPKDKTEALPPPPDEATRASRSATLESVEMEMISWRPSSDWAIDVLRRVAAGEKLPEVSERIALEAVRATKRISDIPPEYMALNRKVTQHVLGGRHECLQ